MKKIVLLAVALAALALVYCLFESTQASKSVFKVGLSADYPPFESLTNGEIVGFDVDLIKAIATEIGEENIKITDMPFHSLIASLESNKMDVAMSALSNTPERIQKVDFSNIYYKPQLSLIYLAGSKPPNIEKLSHLKLGAQVGSIMEMWAKKAIAEAEGSQVFALDSNPMLIEELKNQRIDMIVIEDLQAREFCKKEPGLAFLEVEQNLFGYAIAMKKNSPLIPRINTAMGKLIANDTIKNLQDKWINR